MGGAAPQSCFGGVGERSRLQEPPPPLSTPGLPPCPIRVPEVLPRPARVGCTAGEKGGENSLLAAEGQGA